jgi:hypothetical protein
VSNERSDHSRSEVSQRVSEPIVRRGARIALLACLSLLSSCLCHGPAGGARTVVVQAPAAAPEPPAMDSAPTLVSMRNVDFHLGGDVVMRIRHLHGIMRGRDGIVNFDDDRSFTTWVTSAEAALSGEDMSNLMNNHVFAYKGAPLRNLKIELRDGLLIQSGILHKGVDIPFKIKSQVSVTSDGKLRFHPVDTDIFCVDGDKLMKALGLSMEKMVDLSKAVGVTIKGNDFLIDPIRILPPPTIRGRLIAARVVGNLLLQEIGPEPGSEAQLAQAPIPHDTSVANFMYYRGGRLNFSRKLLMSDADMQVVDDEQSDPFDFDLSHYMPQLTAGYSRTLANGGLYVVMKDARRVLRLEQTVGGEVLSRRDTTCNCAQPARPKP